MRNHLNIFGVLQNKQILTITQFPFLKDYFGSCGVISIHIIGTPTSARLSYMLGRTTTANTKMSVPLHLHTLIVQHNTTLPLLTSPTNVIFDLPVLRIKNILLKQCLGPSQKSIMLLAP